MNKSTYLNYTSVGLINIDVNNYSHLTSEDLTLFIWRL